ncbi:MAG: Hsp20 family protein [candidate division Zixibacteria bacterium]|nr:Hsp20 family protein [candidate division Zixibacteria bacterium]
MALTRFKHRTGMDPWENMRNNLNRYFRNTVNEDDWTEYPSQWAPLVDVSEDEKNIIFRAEIPGIKKDEIKVSVENHTLTVCGEKKEEYLSENENYYRSERTFGHFCRNFSLPSNVDTTEVKANYRDGILKIEIPKIDETKRKYIQVESES